MIVMEIFRKRMYIYNKSKNELQCFVSIFSLGFVRSLKTKGSAMAWAEGPGALQPSPPKLIRWQWFLAHQSQVTSPDHPMCRIFSRWYSWMSLVRSSGTTLCHWLFPASSLGSKHCFLSRACKQFRVFLTSLTYSHLTNVHGSFPWAPPLQHKPNLWQVAESQLCPCSTTQNQQHWQRPLSLQTVKMLFKVT